MGTAISCVWFTMLRNSSQLVVMLPESEYHKILETLSKMNSYSKRIKYAKEHFEYLGSGSSRSVFALDEDSVIKIAKNKFGESQNSVEGDYGLCHMYNHLLAKVLFAEDENYTFIISERAHPVAKSNTGLEKILAETGVDKGDFKKVTQHLYHHLSNHRVSPEDRAEFQELMSKYSGHDIVDEMVNMCINFNLLPGDFERFSSWGFVRRQDGTLKLCLKDFGLTVDNHKEFIMDKRHKQREVFTYGAVRGRGIY